MACSLAIPSFSHHYTSLFSSPTSTKAHFPQPFHLKIKHKTQLKNSKNYFLTRKYKTLNPCFINHHYAVLEDPKEEGQNKSLFHWGIFTNMWWAEFRGAFGQRFNLEGIICAAKVLTKDRHLLLPHLTVQNIQYINWDELHRRGFKGVVFDKDNTLTLPYSLTLYDPLKLSLERCKAMFGEDKVAILSNSAGLAEFDPDEAKAVAIERGVGVKVIRHRVKKPAGNADDIEKQLGCRSSEVVMVGDRRFTDVVYGNRNGFLTVFTEPLTSEGEPFVVKKIRKLEEFLVRNWYRKGLMPLSHCLLPYCDVKLVCFKEPM